MPGGNERAKAYLDEAETTLRSARVLFEQEPDEFTSQFVKNAYDASEQAISAGIAARGEDVPKRHGAKIQRFFEPDDVDELERISFGWHARRSDAQYVDVRGTEISVPSKVFDREDAERILADAETILAYVRERLGDDRGPRPVSSLDDR